MRVRKGFGLIVYVGIVSTIFFGGANVAFAQSSVTLYGTLDVGLIYASKIEGANGQNAGHVFAVNDGGVGPTIFGMRGIEDLGGGLKTEFTLEGGTSVANGSMANSNGNLFGRNAWVGLDSNYGNVKLGLQYSPFALSLYETDPRGGSFVGSGTVHFFDNLVVTSLFNANAITYESPKIAGFTGTAMYALGGTAGDFAAGRQYSFRLTYDAASFRVDAAMYNGNGGGSASSTPVPSTIPFVGRTIGASYFAGSLTMGLNYTLYKVAGSFSSQVYGAGFKYAVTPSWHVDSGVWYTRDGNDSSNHSILGAIGTQYLLSKRTFVYAQVAIVNNHGLMNTGLTAEPIALYEVLGTSNAVNIGIRHSF
jgi:predicted porin